MIERLPERIRTPAVARAVTSPSALLLAGAGMSAAILAGLPIAGAAVAGALAWAARVAVAVPRRPPGERIDAYRLGEQWRPFVLDAQRAQISFTRAVARARPGPVRDRLTELGRRIDEAVTECWRVACQGDTLESAFRQLDVQRMRTELAEVAEERRRRGDEGAASSLARTQQAIEAQLGSAERLWRVAEDARNRLRLLNAQLDEAVARAVELALTTTDASQVRPLSDDVDSLVGELEVLRQALEETRGGTAGATTP